MSFPRLVKAIVTGMVGGIMLLASLAEVQGKSPLHWVSFRRKVEKNLPFELSNKSGPWLVFAASFAGEGAEREALELAKELRVRYKLPAYVHSQTFDFSETVEGLGVNPDRSPKRMRYDKGGVFDEFAVLVGDFNSIDDPGLQKTLKRIKYAQPDCLTRQPNRTTRRFAGLREFQRRLHRDDEDRRKGPMRTAFATPNPLIPREFFAPKGVDKFIINMNKGVKYSLLDCPGKFSVRVATFRGNVIIDQKRVAEIENGGRMQSRLEKAALHAHRLTLALRKKGVEAYEFHDRHESYVTVGNFEWVGRQQGEGQQEMNPSIVTVIERFSPDKQPLMGRDGQALSGIKPKMMDGIPFDVQPWPVEVPRRSIAADYARTR